MADWNTPLLSTAYASFLSIMKDRDFDAGSLFLNAPTNPVTGMIRYVRASNKFQEYDGAVWQDKLLAIAGGGTGGGNASDARTNLGLGTIAVQAANNVNITGGVISGLASFGVNGLGTFGSISVTSLLQDALVVAGGARFGTGAVNLIDTTGKIAALSATQLANLSGIALTNLNASNLASGTVAHARLGSGGGTAVKFLREDNTWQDITVVKSITKVTGTYLTGGGPQNFTITPNLTDWTKAVITFGGTTSTTNNTGVFEITSNSNLSINIGSVASNSPFVCYILEFKNVG